MLHIDPHLLRHTSHSAYRRAMERGYRWLRFEPALEVEFRSAYVDSHLRRMRWAGWVGIALFAAFVMIDVATLPAPVAAWTAGIRLGVIIPALALTLLVSHRPGWRRHVQRAMFVGALACGIGTVAVIGAALRHGYPLPYEGILLVPLFLFMIACMQWWQAVLANAVTLLVFVAMEFALQGDPSARLYQVIFMCAATAVGAFGGYFLEHSTRTTFLVHALLNELAERDGLTGLYNRRTLNAHLDKAWRQAGRDGRDLAIAMIDVDHFKRYNDRYGHGPGDNALKDVADVIASHARRPLDLAARYGGEEFVLVWYQPMATELATMGEQLRAGVAALGLAHADTELGTLSVSVGVALMKPAPGVSSADLLRAADTALYEAKHAGRNRVVVLVHPSAESIRFPLATAPA